MISEEKLEKLYDGVIKGIDLTTKNLKEIGLSSNDLTILVKGNVLKREKVGHYIFIDAEKLFYYGKKLIFINKPFEATICFEKCFLIDPNHHGAAFQLFFRCIRNEKYQEAFKFVDLLLETDNVFYKRDMIYYLYLLSFITDIPEKYKSLINNITFDEICVSKDDKRFNSIYKENLIRELAFKKRFSFAFRKINELTNYGKNMNFQNKFERILLARVVEIDKKNRDITINLVKEHKYEDLIDFLLNRKETFGLRRLEELLLELAKKYLDIKSTCKIPIIKTMQVDTLDKAIAANNFILARNLAKQFNEENNIDNEQSVLYLLLCDICDLIKSLAHPEQTITEEKSEVVREEKQLESPKEPLLTHNNDVPTFSVIVENLLKNDIDTAIINLKAYLKSIGKNEYEFLINGLIKLSLVENDLAFTKPMTALTLINKEEVNFDISYYIQSFYMALSQNRLKEARIYLEIVEGAKALGQEFVLIDTLYKVLEKSEENVNSAENNNVTENVMQKALEQAAELVEPPVVSKVQTPPVTKKENKANKINKKSTDDDVLIVEGKYEELIKHKNLVLLKPMKRERINRILDILERYPDVDAFVIEWNGQEQIVMRYHKFETIDATSLYQQSRDAYNQKDYDKCINMLSIILRAISKPQDNIYGYMGIAFMKKNYLKIAVDYLKIATYLSKKTRLNRNDFTELIAKLTNSPINQEEIKPEFKMLIQEFNYEDVNDFYGIYNFEELNDYINETGCNVEAACEEFGLTKDQTLLVQLIYAREFYFQGNMVKGDLFLKAVEKSKEKTPLVKKIFKEINQNKKFYQGRERDYNVDLKLTLLPR